MFLFRKHTNASCYNRSLWNMNPFTRQASTSKNIILYGDEASPPVRFVMMTASMLKIDYTFHKIDLFKSENKTDFYKQVNPLQKVPALSVDGDVICDSHAIALYLCRINESQDLYPSDALTKAAVDQMLFFNATNLFPVDSFIFSEYFAGKMPINPEKVKEWYFSLQYLDDQLRKHQWLAGDQVRLCDICCGATITSLELLIPRIQEYSAVQLWIERLQNIPSFEINNNGIKRLNSFVEMFGSL